MEEKNSFMMNSEAINMSINPPSYMSILAKLLCVIQKRLKNESADRHTAPSGFLFNLPMLFWSESNHETLGFAGIFHVRKYIQRLYLVASKEVFSYKERCCATTKIGAVYNG